MTHLSKISHWSKKDVANLNAIEVKTTKKWECMKRFQGINAKILMEGIAMGIKEQIYFEVKVDEVK